MRTCRYPHIFHDASHGTTVARRSVTCALAALLTLAAPAAGGVALADPTIPVADGAEIVLVSQNAPAFWPPEKTMNISRTKVLIGEQKALDIALTDLGIKAESCGEIEIDFEEEESPAIYEVEFVHGTIAHEYKIDAFTGKICDHERDILDDTFTIIRRQD